MPLQASNKKSSSKRNIFSFLILCIWLILVAWLIFNHQNIIDWWKLLSYVEPAEVAQISSQDGLTSYAHKIFKVNHPVIENKSSFQTHCPNNGGEQTIVLGCYHSNQNGIYLLSETDPRLNGVEQVTAAHEMLHSAYDRLSSSDKNKINTMLIDYYHNDLTDSRIKKTIEAYQKSEPGSLVNEMHSIFGTEIIDLTPQLESYYKQYFTNRAQIAKFASDYESEFTSRQTLVAQDDIQLKSLKAQIEQIQSDLNTKLSSINSLQSQLQSEKQNDQIAEYNANVPKYNQMVSSYNNEIFQLRSLISSYNTLVAQRNEVALTENQLYKELNGENSFQTK